jgi:thiol-disulfide isomerase/thioredoxin
MRLVALLAVWVCFVVLAPALLIPVIEATTPGDGLDGAAWKWGSEAGVDEFDDDEDDLYGDDLDEELLGRLDDNLVITGRKTAQEVQKQLWERRSEMLHAQMDDVNKEALKAREEGARAAEEQQHQKVVEKQQEVESVPKEPVVALTADTFDAALLRHPYVMAEFYAPWCGHCRKLAPELEAAALQLRYSLPPSRDILSFLCPIAAHLRPFLSLFLFPFPFPSGAATL